MSSPARMPRYRPGQRVGAAVDLLNDGSHPEVEEAALLVAAGTPGEVVQVGHHMEADLPIYMVDFACRRVVGCLEEELTPWLAAP